MRITVWLMVISVIITESLATVITHNCVISYDYSYLNNSLLVTVILVIVLLVTRLLFTDYHFVAFHISTYPLQMTQLIRPLPKSPELEKQRSQLPSLIMMNSSLPIWRQPICSNLLSKRISLSWTNRFFQSLWRRPFQWRPYPWKWLV